MKIKKLIISLLLLISIVFSSTGFVAASEEPDPFRPMCCSIISNVIK